MWVCVRKRTILRECSSSCHAERFISVDISQTVASVIRWLAKTAKSDASEAIQGYIDIQHTRCRNNKTISSVCVRPLLIIGVERDYLRGTICLVPSLTAVLYMSAVHMCTCVCVLSLCGREVV